MFTRVILAAGVAALAISAPVSAKPDRERGGQAAERSGGDDRAQRAERRSQNVQRAERRAERQAMPRFERREQRMERRAERQAMPRFERRQERFERADRAQRFAAFRQERAQNDRRAERLERANRVERQQRSAERREMRANRIERQRRFEARADDRREMRANRIDRRELRNEKLANRIERQQLRNIRVADRLEGVRVLNDNGLKRGFGVGGCPPGLLDKGCMPPGHGLNASRIVNSDAFRASRLASLALGTRLVDPVQAIGFVGAPLASVTNVVPLMVLPQTVQYLYPDTDDYYYRYGGGYVYRVDRDDDLISWILPMIAGGFLPGQYLPASYMNSYVPNYYGFNSFYPSSYGADYGYGYDNLCNRYVNGVIYQVDCMTGLVEDVIPLYASGYGVGQYLPASYGYYNVPYQYRDLYYNTSDYNYWYAPGAIYQVDPTTSLITAIASLLAPGLTIGQQLPVGYGVYNVPLAYRDTYYDTPNAWYRYNNGYIYQVDPTTQLVTAIVASILT